MWIMGGELFDLQQCKKSHNFHQGRRYKLKKIWTHFGMAQCKDMELRQL